jgi:DNA-binding CsgD family transcriptional regulator
MDVISIAFTLLIFVIVLLSNWNWRTSILLWLVLSLFFFAGLFVVAILGLSLNDMGTHIIIPARTLLSFYLWLVLVLETKNRRASMVLALTVFYFGTELASAVVSYVVMPSFATQLSALSDGYGIAITIGVMFVLIVSSLLFLGIILLKREETGYESEKVVVEAGAGQERLTLDICRGLIPAYGLTTREAEIMALIARGHSVKKIAEVLTISPTTVQSHSRSLYRKLDVHDRQQIIDLVDNLLTR